MRKGWKIALAGVAVVVVALVVVLWDGIRVILSPTGRDMLTEMAPVEYNATRDENLRAIHTALMLYHQNEERFPEANGWMDAILPSLRTADLKEGEERKKLQNPLLPNLDSEQSGYVLNKNFAGQFRDDVRSPSNVLVFESRSDRRWNAASAVAGDRDLKGITIDGRIVELSAP